jgi:hypothetical protein
VREVLLVGEVVGEGLGGATSIYSIDITSAPRLFETAGTKSCNSARARAQGGARGEGRGAREGAGPYRGAGGGGAREGSGLCSVPHAPPPSPLHKAGAGILEGGAGTLCLRICVYLCVSLSMSVCRRVCMRPPRR